MEFIARLLIFFGIVLILVGFLFFALSRFVFKDFIKLPGDILIKRDNFLLYFPITSAIIVSLVLTIILNIIIFFSSKK